VWLASLFGLIGSGISGFFGVKNKQAEVVEKALDTVDSINHADAESAVAAADALSSLYKYGAGIERIWRPLLMIYLILLISLAMFSLINPEAWIMAELLSLLKAGVYGYIPLRTTEKLTTMFLVNKTLQKVLLEKIR